MALQFELREIIPRDAKLWRGPVARPVKDALPETGSLRLGVRPVSRSASGNWARTGLSWANLPYQSGSANLNTTHHLWFSQFAALHRPVREVFYGQEPDWIYLDDYQSPLLWRLLAEAPALGIALVASDKNTTIHVAEAANVSLDASRMVAPRGRASRGQLPLTLTPIVTIDGRDELEASVVLISHHGLYAVGGSSNRQITLATFGAASEGTLNDEHRAALIGRSPIVVPADSVHEFLRDYSGLLRRSISLTSADATVKFPEIAPPTLVLTATFAPKHRLKLAWHWQYGGTSLPPHGDERMRDSVAENIVLERMVAKLAATSPHGPAARLLDIQSGTLPQLAAAELESFDAAEFAEHGIAHLEAIEGIRVAIVGDRPQYRELQEPPKLRIRTVETEQHDWFDLGVIVTVGDYEIPFGPLFAALSRGRDRLLLIDGSHLSLRQPQFERLQELISEARELAEWETGVRISRYQTSLWADFEDLADESEPAESWRAAAAGLLDVTTIESVPHGLNATLRPYQQDGFDWLAFLHRHGLGGILADDMGLGKTLQALALMEHASRGDARPFLVVAPTSVVSNWLQEAARFAPKLRVAAITSTQTSSSRASGANAGAARVADAAVGNHIVVTSYALFRLDFEAYQAQEWAGLILDEAQFVKNPATKAHQCARDLGAPFTLAITGTPMENNLMELWALFAIVAPGLFPSARRFAEEYARPIERGDAARLERLRRRIRPFMMRRTKALVANELPAKQEQLISVELKPRHRRLYDTVLQRERQKLLGLIDDIDKNRMTIFRSLTLLRMLSLDASLVDDAHAGIPSSKLDVLFEHLIEVVAERHRTLIFSQFTSYLRKTAERLDAHGIAYVYLDGSTRRRAQVIASFTEGTAPVFLISLKAGGFGLNLTEADYVFLLDPWWNPATEAQAIDRTHRIGQQQTVMVYRMIAADTIEEKVMALQEKKARLFNSVMDDGAIFSSALTAEDIRGLLDE